MSFARLERSNPFVPPQARPARVRAWLLAAAAHSLLLVAMLWTVKMPKPVVLPMVQAEFWEPQEEPPPPAQPPALRLPPPTQPTQQDLREAEIALERKRQQERAEQLAREQAAREQAEKAEAERQAAAARARAEQAAREQAAREQEEKAEAARQAAAAQARAEQAAREAREKAEAEKQAAEKKAAEERRRQQQAQAAERRRQENIRRMQQMAGRGAPAAGAQPSQEYLARVAALIRSKINYTGLHAGNPLAVVRVRAAADGRIVQINLMQRSGTQAWDDAVLRALHKTPALPRDDDGRIPATDIIIDFRPDD